jgi:two-component system, cell cycle sensor histidine kinase and response regulator CckA
MAVLVPGVFETILVVEDTPSVLATVRLILKNAGFTVLEATSAEQAIQIESNFAGTIHLLLSDVMMPGMSGSDLAKVLVERRKDMRVMMMSGYPGGDLLVLNYGWYFIHKPFVPKGLLERVNDVLHGRDRSQGTDHFGTEDLKKPS